MVEERVKPKLRLWKQPLSQYRKALLIRRLQNLCAIIQRVFSPSSRPMLTRILLLAAHA
jgi:hypothetical protein